jgi:hypothetical protein
MVTGTHTGDLMGMPATGKRISVQAVDIGRSRTARPRNAGAASTCTRC